MRVLVTGGSGKLGRYVVRELLTAGHAVRVMDRVPSDEGRTEFVEGDILDLPALERACAGQDALIHLAAIPHPMSDPPEVVFRVNALGTFHAFEAAARAGIMRLALASSDSTRGLVFATHRERVRIRYFPVDERQPLEPQDPYGLSKLVGEQIAATFVRRTGGTAVCLRPCWIWAPEEREVVARLVEHPEEWVQGLWAYVHVLDAARAFRLAVEAPVTGFHAMLIRGDENSTRVDSVTLARRYYPHVPLKPGFGGRDSFLSGRRAARVLGFRPQHTWREIVEA